jgi:hypothetical protein
VSLSPVVSPTTQPTDGNGDVIHIVGGMQHMLDVLHLKVPRALCGELLIGDPDRAEPGANAPVCRACEAKER